MEFTTILGLVAGTFTTFAGLPQLVKSYKTKSTKDISLGLFLMLFIGVNLWFVYGILMSDVPIIVANALSIVIAGSILILKLKYNGN